MKDETKNSIYNIIKSSEQVNKPTKQIYVEFMVERFLDDGYIHITYAEEWAERFNSKDVKGFMDSTSKSIYERILNR